MRCFKSCNLQDLKLVGFYKKSSKANFYRNNNWHFAFVSDAEESILASIAKLIAPVFAPAGLGYWQIEVALVSGFMAKESVVSTLEILFAGGLEAVLSPLPAVSLLVFSLLYTPCIAAVASVKRELGIGWAVSLVVWQCVLAWLCAFLVNTAGMLLL